MENKQHEQFEKLDYKVKNLAERIEQIEVDSKKPKTSNSASSAIFFDDAPTANSQNAVTSGGVFNALSQKQNTLSAGTGILIEGNQISTNGATVQEKLVAGNNIRLDGNIISATGTTYTAGTGIDIENNQISADTTTLATKSDLTQKQDVLTAGDNISINNGVISATNTTYTAGTGIDITNGVISSTASGVSEVTASDVNSQNATQGQVLTADGSGGASWQNASGGDTTALENQVDTNTSDIAYIKSVLGTVVTPSDPSYSPQTPSDYPAGTIFTSHDYVERKLNMYSSNSAVKPPKVYFCAEAGSSADFCIELDIESRAGDIDALISCYINGTLAVQDTVTLTDLEKYSYQKYIYGYALSSNTKANSIYVTLSHCGTGTIGLTRQKISVSAPNAEIFNKISPYSVEYIGGDYYIADCSSGEAKLAVINAENMVSMSNLNYESLGFEAQHLACGKDMKQYTDGSWHFNELVYGYNTKEMKVRYKLVSTGKIYTNSIYENFDWFVNRSASVRFSGSIAPNRPAFSMVNPTSTSVSSGILSNKFYDVITTSPAKMLTAVVGIVPSYVFAQIRSNGEVHLGCYNRTTDQCNISLGHGTKARIYFKSVASASKFAVTVFIKRYDKILKYECHLNSYDAGFVIDSVTEIGSYDDFFLGANNDYFVIKNNVLEYHKFPSE